MKGLLIMLCFVAGLATTGFSQYLTAKDSDPEALALLTKAGKVFSSGNIQVNFKVKTIIPGQQPMTSDGVYYQGGKSYRVELKDYNIISNGQIRWVYLKGPNEVNIYNESAGQDWIGP
ncbi:MAG: hypothetical protein M3R25_13215, partial [Bacteroidota bacterium]|nr:hypothetical protein [Bacteroidota bacterium]